MVETSTSFYSEDPLEAFPGLSETEVASRVSSGDVNLVVFRSTRTYREIVQENVLTTFHISFSAVLVLLAALGQVTDAIFSGITVLSNIVVGVVQEVQAKWALDKLALLSVQQATVRRSGVSLIVPLEEIVRDDIIELKPGDRAAVDGPTIFSQMLEMDESLLTGESEPVAKQAGDPILSGSFCLSGSGLFQASKIGHESYAAKISESSRSYKRSVTPLQAKIDAIVEIFVLALAIAGFLHLASSLNSGRSLVDTLRYAAVIINSFVPAGLVLSISVALALGAVEISRHQTLIQRINAVDSMNSVRVLCTDKTGTLTQNKLSVQSSIALSGTDESLLQELLALYVTLIAAQNTSAKAMSAFVGLPKSRRRKHDEIAFSSGRKWGAVTISARASESDDRLSNIPPHGQALPNQAFSIIVGAPEALLCDPAASIEAKQLSAKGLRVIAVATSSEVKIGKQLPASRQDRGLVLLKDDLRPDAIDTIAALQVKGIQIKVISGDSIDTVAAIAQQAGIPVSEANTFSQADLDSLDEAGFSHAANAGRIFGRITPETKRALIAAMVRRGAYVGMVGDGVNDVPAFKEAQLAIAMNDGAQISKDIADIVLLNNSLATLPQAFSVGDEIKQKILSSARLYLTKNIMVILTISFVGFVQLPFPIEPRQLTVLTFSVVSVPTIMISLGMLKPRRVNSFIRNVLGYSFLAGLVGAMAMTLGYILTYFGGLGLLDAPDAELPLAVGSLLQLGRGQAQAVSTLIGLFYCLLIYWENSHISIWRPLTLMRSRKETLLGLGLVLGSIAVMLISPQLFQIEIPNRIGWSVALFLPFAAHYLLRMIQSSSLLRHLPRALTQP
jgi:cation-transporting ATPase E